MQNMEALNKDINNFHSKSIRFKAFSTGKMIIKKFTAIINAKETLH